MSSIEPVVALPGAGERGSDRKRAFGFGLVIAIVCAGIGAVGLYRGAVLRGYSFIGVGVAVLVYSIVHPGGALVLRRGWLFLGGILGRINSVIILAAAYVVILTPLSVLVRLFGKKSFKPDRRASYFTTREEQRDAKHFEHPY